MKDWIKAIIARVGLRLIHMVVLCLGKRVAKADAPWLVGPTGENDVIGPQFYQRLADKHQWSVRINSPESGLMPDFEVFDGPGFDSQDIHPRVRDFYEQTSGYHLDVWSETRAFGRAALWLLVSTVSRYMNQLNFPIFGLELSKGLKSDIIQLYDKNNTVHYTGWFRQVVASRRMLYTGFYMTATPPKEDRRCIKVVFPVPGGNATVLLRPQSDGDRLILESGGESFGNMGFYRTAEVDEDHIKVLHLKYLKERFEVYVDEEDQLRCDHLVQWMGLTIVRLHYHMQKRPERWVADAHQIDHHPVSFSSPEVGNHGMAHLSYRGFV